MSDQRIFAILMVIAFSTGMTAVTVATPAKDNPNGGFCKNGHPTKDLKYCHENRGRR
jgi:hypothetical protein